MLGLAHVVDARRPPRPRASSTTRTEGYEAVAELLDAVHARRRSRRSPASPPPTSSRPRTSTARPARPRILWGLGVTEHKYGSEVVRLICNLAMMTGKVGRPGSALLPLRGQNNVQGSSDMGALPDTYTAYRPVGDEEVARSLRGGLGRPALAREGLHDPADVRRRGRRAAEGDVHLRRGRRPDRPQHRPRRRARSSRSSSSSARTSSRPRRRKYADVILPASSFLEKDGHVHQRRAPHPARRARRSTRPARRKTDFEIITDGLAGARPRDGLRRPGGRDGRDRGAHARTSPASATSASAARGLQWPVARRRHRRADPLRGASSTSPDGLGALRARSPTSRPATPPTTTSR